MVIISLFILLVIGIPIAYIFGITSVVYFIQNGPQFLRLMPQRFHSGTDSFVLLAIPFFIFAGELMNATGITSRLIRLAKVLVGRVHGYLAYANVVASILFAGITGAAVSDVAALGSIFIPAMKKQGYSGPYSAAITAVSSIIGPTIPPSTPILVYGALTGTSIAAMFAAAVVPGLLLGFSQMMIIKIQAKKKGFPQKDDEKFSAKEVVYSLWEGIPAVIMPVIILFGILSGVFTPTEAAVVAGAYALLFGLGTGSLPLSEISGSLKKAVRSSALILLIIGCANIFGWIIAKEQLARIAASYITKLTENPSLILLLVIAFLLFVGTWMETLVAITLLSPFLSLLATQVGLDPVHFGIIVVITLNIGMVTPPVGVCLYVAGSVSGETFESITKEAFPYVCGMVIVLLIVAFFPCLALWLPSVLNLL